MISAIAALAFVIGYIYFSFNIIKLRRKLKVGLGDGGKKELQYAIRAQGNYFEYGVVFILLLLIAQIVGTHQTMLIISLVFFVIGRVLHAAAFLNQEQNYSRERGMQFTFIGILMIALALLISLF